MIRCEVCNQEFNSQEEYEKHWKYILETPQRQYNELVEDMRKKLIDARDKKRNECQH